MSTPAPPGALRAAAIAMSVMVTFALTACVAPVSLDAPPVAELPAPVPAFVTTRLLEDDRGRRIVLKRGESFAVSLRAPVASGIGWSVTRVPSGLVPTGRFSGPVWPPGAPSSTLAPAPLWQVFVFETVSVGEDELVIELSGPDGDRPRRFTLRIAVVAG